MSWHVKKRLPPEVEEKACEMILDGKKLDEVSEMMGLQSRRALQKYLITYPEFKERLDGALVAYCIYLEEELLAVCDNYNDKYAKVKLEAIAKILKYRDPKRYGDKTQIDVSMNVDIAGSLERAERRVIEANALNVIPLVAAKNESTDAPPDQF